MNLEVSSPIPPCFDVPFILVRAAKNKRHLAAFHPGSFLELSTQDTPQFVSYFALLLSCEDSGIPWLEASTAGAAAFPAPRGDGVTSHTNSRGSLPRPTHRGLANDLRPSDQNELSEFYERYLRTLLARQEGPRFDIASHTPLQPVAREASAKMRETLPSAGPALRQGRPSKVCMRRTLRRMRKGEPPPPFGRPEERSQGQTKTLVEGLTVGMLSRPHILTWQPDNHHRGVFF